AISPEEAVTRINTLAAESNRLGGREAELQELITKTDVEEDFSNTLADLKRFGYDSELFLHARLVALLSSMVDTSEIDVAWESEGHRRLDIMGHTMAAKIAADRRRRIDRITTVEELLSFLDEVLQEPLLRLQRNPEE